MILCFACGNYNTLLICHIYTNIHIGTYTHTQSHRFKFFWFFGNIAKLNTRAMRQYWSAKFNIGKIQGF